MQMAVFCQGFLDLQGLILAILDLILAILAKAWLPKTVILHGRSFKNGFLKKQLWSDEAEDSQDEIETNNDKKNSELFVAEARIFENLAKRLGFYRFFGGHDLGLEAIEAMILENLTKPLGFYRFFGGHDLGLEAMIWDSGGGLTKVGRASAHTKVGP